MTTRAPPGCNATSCGRPFRWRSTARSLPTPSISAPACRCTVRSRRPTRAGSRPTCRTPPHDPDQALELLASIGLTDRNGDGRLEDAQGRPARFTLLTQRGRTPLERGAAVIRDELAKIGLIVDVVALDGAAVVQKFVSGRDYDAVYFSVFTSDTDPAINADFWFSSGSGARVEHRPDDAGDRRGSARSTS